MTLLKVGWPTAVRSRSSPASGIRREPRRGRSKLESIGRLLALIVFSRHLTSLLRICTAALFAALVAPVSAQNVIQAENAKTAGVTSQWFIHDASYASNREIEGYASATSVNRGGSISLYVQTSGIDATYTINVYRVGWYGGAGGRLALGPIMRGRAAQPACPMTDAATRLIECNWTDPYVLTIPNNTADATDPLGFFEPPELLVPAGCGAIRQAPTP